jgi:hypothetical protein
MPARRGSGGHCPTAPVRTSYLAVPRIIVASPLRKALPLMPASRHHRRHPQRHQHPSHDREALSRVTEDVDPKLLEQLDEAKAAVGAALDRLGDPVGAAMDEIGPQEFITTVWRIGPPGRTQFLNDLGVPSARRPTLVSARLGLSRLRSWPGDKRRRTARFLTTMIADTIDDAWDGCDGSAVADRTEAVRQVLTASPDNASIIRLTVLAHARTTAAMAVALRLALQNGLTLSAWTGDDVDVLADACADLRDVWLAIEDEVVAAMRERDGQDDEPDETGGAAVQTAEIWDGGPGTDDEQPIDLQPGPDTAQRQASTSGADQQPPGSGPGELAPDSSVPDVAADQEPAAPHRHDPELLAEVAADLRQLHTAARRAVETLAARLEDGQLPSEKLIMPLAGLTDAGRTAVDMLLDAGHQVEDEPNVDDLVTALLDVAATAGADRRDREAIKSLAGLSGPEQSAGQVAGVRDLAASLALADTWDDDQRRLASGLLALLDVIAAAAAGDTHTAADAHTRAQQQLPAELAPLTIAALLNQLSPAFAGSALASSGPGVPDADGTDPGVDPGAVALLATEPAGTVIVQDPMTDATEVLSALTGAEGTAAQITGEASRTATAPDDVAAPDTTDDDETTISAPMRQPAANMAADRPGSLASGGSTAALDDGLSRETHDTDPDADRADAEPHAQVPGDDDSGARSRQLIRDLVAGRRLSLAFHACAASGDRRRSDALRILTLADAARSETSSTAGALRAAIEEDQRSSPAGDPATQLILLAGCLRACLVTADPTAGEAVLTLARMMQQLPGIAALATTIGTASKHGLLYSTAVLTALAPIAGADNDIAATIDAATVERDRPRNLDFVRANQLVELWWSRTGLIGALLDTVIHDRRSKIDDVLDELRRLSRREDLSAKLDRQDNEIRSTSSRELQGQARRKLIEQARTSLDVVRAWVDAVRANPSDREHAAPVPAALTDLRQKVKAQWPAAEQDLLTLVEDGPDTLAAEAATLCRDHLQRSVGMLDGAVLRGTDRDPDAVLHQDLLRAPGLPFTDTGLPARKITIDDVAVAARTDWDAAFDARLTDEQFGTALQITAAVGDPARAVTLRVRLDDAAARTLAELRDLHRDVAAQIARASRLGQLDEAASTAVNSNLEATTIVHHDEAALQNLGVIRTQLQDIRDSLPRHRQHAQDALRARAVNEITAGTDDARQLITLIEQRINAGDLATAEEYLLAAIAGEAPPSEEPSQDLAVFAGLRDLLPDGITSQTVAAARDGQTLRGMDFSALSEADRDAAARGLGEWLGMRAENHNNVTRSALATALRLAGIEFLQLLQVNHLPSGNRRAWRDLANVTRTGEPLIPAFGSKPGNRLRVMLCWGDQDTRTLMSLVEQDPGTDPVLVLLFTAMSTAQRNALAVACTQRLDKPVLVLDDIALVHLALHGASRFPAMERILLPYAATNPYYPRANADVPSEMFFGRRDEIGKIIDSLGPNLIYGGRQLGKSALLQASARRFELVRGCVAVYVSLPNGVGVSVKADALWDTIYEKLTERHITAPRRTRDPVKNVTTAVSAWLADDPSRRILLLIDECDRFFDADAETDFAHTTQLRNLMIDTKRRFKAVFAGLHQVQRFAHLPNQPLAGAHLGDQVAIGPLSPLPAYRLMFVPMETLGIRFASDELIHRILAYCNYQPKLLQLIGEELVRSALEARRTGPPYVISDANLEHVLDSEVVRQRVRETVHLTLNLDSRYKLIALVVALAAVEHGADYTMSTSRLREQCQQWWEQGFAGQGMDEFASLLEEMRDLGVLAVADAQWRLRSSNVLRLLGSASRIEEELCSPEWRTTVTKLSTEQARRQVGDSLISPFTERQLSRLIARGVQLRVVAGTPATGVSRVRELLEEARGFGARFELAVPTAPAAYTRELRAGAPGGVHRVVLSDLTSAKVDAVLEALDRAGRMQPPPGVTRTVVAVVDASVQGILAMVASPGAAISDELVMPLRRVSATGLRSWLSDNERMSCFGNVTMHTALMTATGGWLTLLDRAAERAREIGRAQRICDEITADLATAAGAEQFLTAVGLRADARAAAAFGVLVEYADPVSTEDLVNLCAEAGPDAARTAAVLRLLDVVVQGEADGLWTPEPVASLAWAQAQDH